MTRSAVLIVLLALAALPASATTYLVRPDGTGDYPTIQAAVDAAVNGDVIQLADGTFTGPGNRDVNYGGKAITVRSQSGQPGLCIIDCEGSATAPHRGFLIQSVSGPGAVLEGVTVINGYTDVSSIGHGGGAVFCVSSAARLSNCVFQNCFARSNGGCVCCTGSDVVMTSCAFLDGETGQGGGGGALNALESQVLLQEVSFERNTTAGPGGAIYSLGSSTLTVERCRFQENAARSYGGAMECEQDGGCRVSDCVFVSNRATMQSSVGGAIDVRCYEGPLSVLERCSFYDNQAHYGGAIYVIYESVSISDCTMNGNAATEGGGIFIYGGSFGEPDAQIENTIITSSEAGAGLVSHSTGVVDISCTDIYGNAGGDWIDEIAHFLGVMGNISADPLFCNPEADDFRLQQDSPCAPGTECDLMGAWPVGCGGTPVEQTTWGALKALFR